MKAVAVATMAVCECISDLFRAQASGMSLVALVMIVVMIVLL